MHDLLVEIEGQEKALTILSKIHKTNRIPNALLFSGPSGIGKHFAAIQFIKMLNSDDGDKTIHQKINKLLEPYVKMIFPLPRGRSETSTDKPTAKLTAEQLEEIQEQLKIKSNNPYHQIFINKANTIKISSIREINKSIALNYDEIKYRGIIISDADKMGVESQNAFLKNLEEPPEGVIYILITSKPSQMLRTIISRCWEINFSPLSDKSLNKILTTHFQVSSKDIELVIPFAQGSVTTALFLVENDIQHYLKKAIIILRYALAKRYNTAYQEFVEIMESKSSFMYQLIIDFLITWLNDTLKEKYSLSNIQFQNEISTLEKFNQVFPNVNVNKIVENLVQLRNSTEQNISLNLLAMNVIMEISSLEKN